MVKGLVLGTGFAVIAISFLAGGPSAQAATTCSLGDKECIREQVLFNISSGAPVLNNIPLGNRFGGFDFANNPALASRISRIHLNLTSSQVNRLNGFISANGAALFSKLSTLDGGLYLTLINRLLKQVGANPIP